MNRGDMNKVVSMLETLNHRGDKDFPAIVEMIAKSYSKYRPDLVIAHNHNSIKIERVPGKVE